MHFLRYLQVSVTAKLGSRFIQRTQKSGAADFSDVLEDKKAGLQVAQTHLGFVVFLRETSSKQLYLVCLQKSINTGTPISPTLSNPLAHYCATRHHQLYCHTLATCLRRTCRAAS